jgi:hypothetical protein
MSSFTRVEFSIGPRLRSSRLVLLIDFPAKVLQQFKKGKASSEMEAHGIALDVIRALHFGSPRGDMIFMSSTPGKIKSPESLGDPDYVAEDGCRAWVIKRPDAL